MEFFDQNSFTIFLMFCAVVYIILSNWLQKKFGKSERLMEIQKELNAINKGVGEASKRKDNAAVEELMKKQSPLLSELMSLQMRMLPITLGLFIPVIMLLSAVEPYMLDDSKIVLFDDGLLSHCDAAANDLIYSNCLALNSTSQKGAWVFSAEAFLNGAQVAQNATAFYVEKGKPEDVFIQAKQHGILDIVLGTKAVSISPYTDKTTYSSGESVQFHAIVSEQVDKVDASINNGTFYFVDLPIPIPLLNIQRLVGATGFFILCTFIFSLLFSFAKGILKKMNIYVPFVSDKPAAQSEALRGLQATACSTAQKVSEQKPPEQKAV